MELHVWIDDDSTLGPEQRFQLLADIGEMVRRRKAINNGNAMHYIVSEIGN